jgi:uncharacterized membrane protein
MSTFNNCTAFANTSSISMNNQHRFQNIDILRGLLMVIMAIDHCFLFIYKTHYSESWNELIPNYGSIPVFFTRWISNICAPGFALLMGMSMSFSLTNKERDINIHSNMLYFIKRGAILIILQQLLDLPIILFNLDTLDTLPLFRGGILYALGVSLIFSSLIINVKPFVQICIGVGVVFINYFITSSFLTNSSNNTILNLFFVPGFNNLVSINYPALPWIGITIIGLGLGKIALDNNKNSNLFYLKAGIIFILIFVVLRYINYGDYNHKNFEGIINYLAVIKYPPSIAFIIVNMGLLSLLFWIISEFEKSKYLQPLIVFGQSSLFFYFAHMYVFILLSKLVSNSLPLITMYLFWLVGLLLLFPLCKYYLKFKSRQSKTSIWRYF